MKRFIIALALLVCIVVGLALYGGHVSLLPLIDAFNTLARWDYEHVMQIVHWFLTLAHTLHV
ncbi:hypothetical protein [Ktedonospora formicarum]|uniref:Uncharacterized protein n=1 Tax=Ktedonospora formicarum TaxID=2778364 RepID=A0A8J3MRL3_9CHLR|nr:hypothetical protein [Ktedonospora formicarum]GHO45175.1 hypothetical protein KSX_33380 [Ktedonospora formicarum]